MTETRQAMVDQLRSMADTIENNPDLPLPTGIMWNYVDNKEDMAMFAKAYSGKFEKVVSEYRFMLEQRTTGITYQIDASREKVCEKIVKGTETVTKYRPVEGYTPPPMEEYEEEQEVIEWKCPDSIMAAGAQ